MRKLIFLQSHPIQYFDPLSKLFGEEEELDFEVWYCSDSSIKGEKDVQFGVKVKWDIPMLQGYKYRFFKNYSFQPGTTLKFGGLVNLGLIPAILKSPKSVIVVHGWCYFSLLLTIVLGFLAGHKIWIKCESPLNQELKKSRSNKFIKQFFLRHLLFKMIDKFLFIGKQNKEFYKYYGVDEKDLIFTPYCVDNSRFSQLKNEIDREAIRSKFNITPTDFVILYSGKYIQKKRPLDILKAYAALGKSNKWLILMGEGSLRPAMEDFIKSNNIENVILTGFINQSEIGNYYALADAFVLCSDIGETWGLCVNEAMNFELPIIISDMPGSGFDLVKNNLNGIVYPKGNIAQLQKALESLISNQQKSKQMGKRSGEFIKDYSYEVNIKSIKEAVEIA